ncbi:hypothetical protein EBU99_09230 [bacterium]|nr:hypothetical protein [bacterium]
MNVVLIIVSAVSAGGLLSWGLFQQVATVVSQRHSIKGLIFKLLGIAGLLTDLYFFPADWLITVATFFATALICLVFLTLARDKLLR